MNAEYTLIARKYTPRSFSRFFSILFPCLIYHTYPDFVLILVHKIVASRPLMVASFENRSCLMAFRWEYTSIREFLFRSFSSPFLSFCFLCFPSSFFLFLLNKFARHSIAVEENPAQVFHMRTCLKLLSFQSRPRPRFLSSSFPIPSTYQITTISNKSNYSTLRKKRKR